MQACSHAILRGRESMAASITKAAAAMQSSGAEHVASAHCLPADILRRCMEGLRPSDLLAASEACKEWHQVASSDCLWMTRFEKDFCRSEDIVDSRSGSSNLGCPAAQPFVDAMQAADNSAVSDARWHERYRERAEVESNWRAAACTWTRLEGHRDYIRCAQLRGSSLATCSGSYMQRDCSIRLWDVETSACLEHMPGHQGPIWSMQFDGRRVASCDDEGSVRLWDVESHRVGVAFSLEPHCLRCLSLDGRQLAVAGESGLLALWPLSAIQQALEQGQPPGAEAMGGDGDSGLPSWQPVALEMAGVHPCLARLPLAPGTGPPADANCLQIDGGLCAAGSCGPSGQVHLWGTAGDELVYRRGLPLPDNARGVATLSFQHCTGWLVAGSGSGLVQVWDLHSTQLLHDLRGHWADVLCHQQSGARLATGSADRTVRLWDLRCAARRDAAHVLQLGTFPYSLQLDDWRLAVGCGNGTVQVVDLRAVGAPGSKLVSHTVLPAHQERVWALALSASRLVSASLDAEIVVRSFLPSDPVAMEQERAAGSGLGSGDSAAEGGATSLAASSSSDIELDSA